MNTAQFDWFLEALQIDLNRERADRIFDTLVATQYKSEDVNKELRELRGTE